VTDYRQTPYAAPPGAVDLLLVRHGASAAFVPGSPFELVDGHGDPPLAPEGVAQADQVGARLAGEKVDALYVTNLQRTAQTAAPLAALTGLPVLVEGDLREVFLGEWEGGLLRQKFGEGDPISFKVFETQRWDAIPGAEPAEEFSARIRSAIERIAARHADERVVVFTHGGVIAEIMSQATDSRPFAFGGADNTSISEIVVIGDRWILRRFNDTAHMVV
jgi:probable phosphoglycerate mutase